MGLSDYNGFPGKLREASLRRVHKLWDSGEVPRPEKCDACGQTEGTIHGHSEDYSDDRVHIPICITCHLILHMRFQQPKLWDLYRAMVREGFQGVPLEQKNALYRIKQIYPLSTDPKFDPRAHWPMTQIWDRRSATVLDMICPIKYTHPNSPAAAADHTVIPPPARPAYGGNNPFARP